MVKAVLVDISRCMGCRGCQVACKQWNERKGQSTRFGANFTSPTKLNAETYTRIRFVEAEENQRPVWSFVKEQCFHCQTPACASACPVGALEKTEHGPVTYSFDKCIGCRYCMIACPFDIPKYEWDVRDPSVQKCGFCSERISEGMEPACIKTCPSQAMYFDDLPKVVAEAKKRLSAAPNRYVNYIYGLEEVGGTSWMYISDVPFEKLGFKTGLPKERLPDYTWAPLSTIPFKVAGFFALLGTVAYLRNRGSKEDNA